MKLTLTFTNDTDIAKVDKRHIYRTYFTFPSEVLELSDVREKILHVVHIIDSVIVAYLSVSCDELGWKDLLIQNPDTSQKRYIYDFATGSSLRFHNRLARKKRDKFKTLTILGGGFGYDVSGAYNLAKEILNLLKVDGSPWEIYKVKAHNRDNRVVAMFNQRVKSEIKKEKKRERETAKKAKLEADGKQPKRGQVYFIQQGENGAIKIGYSTNPEKRLKTLSTASPYPLHLRLLLEGGKKLERDLHEKFADCQLDGEWFEATDNLLQFINKKRQDKS